MNYLRKSEYLPFAPNEGQIHINHAECEAGTDTKKRLYIRRLDDGCVLAHCHHCGKSGSYNENKFRSLAAIKKRGSVGESGSRSVSLPIDFESDVKKWDAKARAWVYQYGITDEEIRKYGIGYSAKNGRVILPSWEDGKLLGYQMRRIFDHDLLPKYVTYYNKKNYTWKDLTCTNNILVLCEDVLSAIKLHRYYASMALLGTHLHKDSYECLLDFQKIIIYLDNNNAEVKLKRSQLQRSLAVLVPDTRVCVLERDPKTLSNKELEYIK
jgi:hypothetical protein